jgi:RNA polymerase sigma factor (sigma-70 family)
MSAIFNSDRFRILLRSNPTDAIKLLYQLFYRRLFNIALMFTRDQDAAWDIVQETFLLVWTNRKELTAGHEKSIEHYLVRIVRNKSITYFGRRRFIDIDDLGFLNNYTGTTHPIEETIIERELLTEMRAYILSFSLREQQCLLMKIDKEMSLDQIATELNISRKMVEKSQTNALKRLKKWASRQNRHN